jgi:hypothetical protein
MEGVGGGGGRERDRRAKSIEETYRAGRLCIRICLGWLVYVDHC